MIELKEPIDTVSLCPVCDCAIRKLEAIDIVGCGSFVYMVHENCIKRPTKPAAPEWDGEGLPPVGCECEYRPDPKHDFWDKCAYLAHFDGEHFVIVLEAGDVDRMSDRVSAHQRFRPIRTQAEREDLIAAADAVLSRAVEDDQPMAQALYDAGMLRKGEGGNEGN